MIYDYVIVGAGSAGCVLAARLSEDPATRVLLLEAGGPDSKQEIRIPAAFSKLFNTEVDWAYHTLPQPGLDGRRLFWPRGKMLGGSSSMNAMMWLRGVAADYDGWAAAGNDGWSWDDVAPYFRRAEDTEPAPDTPAPALLGVGGPVPVSRQRDPNPSTELFVRACERLGIPRNPAVNTGSNDGVALTMVNQRRGARVSSASAYLKPAMKRPNLTVETGARVTRVVIDDATARGVEYRVDGTERTVEARREVILSGGAINTPQILMLSGIGPRGHLEDVGVEVVRDLPGVGSNLADHLAAGVIEHTDRPDTLVAAETPIQIVNYLVRRRGLLSSNVAEAHAFIRTEPALAGPDIELIFAPVPFHEHGQSDIGEPGLTIGVVLLQPESRGTVRLASRDALSDPLIDPAYLSADGDLDTLARGVERAIEVFETEPLRSIVTGPMIPDSIPRGREEVEAVIRRRAETLYHPAGTCRMGIDDQAVVGPDLRVRGIARLRVADVSVMPSLVRGHTHAPAVMIGEKAADLVLSSR